MIRGEAALMWKLDRTGRSLRLTHVAMLKDFPQPRPPASLGLRIVPTIE